MKLVTNKGNDRVKVIISDQAEGAKELEFASSELSIFALSSLIQMLPSLSVVRAVFSENSLSCLNGDSSEVSQRNQLESRAEAKKCIQWLEQNGEVKLSTELLPQSAYSFMSDAKTVALSLTGNCSLTLAGLGEVPGSKFSMIQCASEAAEHQQISAWLKAVWDSLPNDSSAKPRLINLIKQFSQARSASSIYHLMLYHLFSGDDNELNEDKIIKSATGIKNTVVWKKLYKFQKDGVVGAIQKMEKFGGCIIADSVGLGKTFEALAVIKYYELRNDRVLVLCPKRLRDNWTVYASNDKRNLFSKDRFNYDVLNHTDLSREKGYSGDIDLSYINWGNYDLIVIDESHNFRNKKNSNDGMTRYECLMRKIIQAGVKTRVLMLSATPVNNRLSDLKNQLAFITEGKDDALADSQIYSIESTVQKAQRQFNRWLDLDNDERTAPQLMNMLGFDYFKLLDLLTIARSRKHIQRYYGIAETGEFPKRLAPINVKSDVDITGAFPSIRDINNEIRRLNLSVYAPLRYVLQSKQKAYDEHYSTKLKSGQGLFRQQDREESLVHLLRVNMLKRMESSVHAFALTLGRQLADIDRLLSRIDDHAESIEEVSIDDIDIDDSTFESLLVGKKVKVLLSDCDVHRWRQELTEDRNRIAMLLSAANAVKPATDSKLRDIKALIENKLTKPINANNKKIIIFTAFADTADYLYANLQPWCHQEYQLHSALVRGTGSNKTSLEGVTSDLSGILTAFSPLSKERNEEDEHLGEIDILIATDCISEGQNLQDCDYLINYDIHWNPVRIIQRFGRIDRLGSINDCIQLVNFWPNIELEEYINLEQKVSGRMVLLDISATGEENLIEQNSGDQMNDLEYRKNQLLKLQETVIDLEDLSSGVSITDLTLNDFRMDLAHAQETKESISLEEVADPSYDVENASQYWEKLPLGLMSVTTALNTHELQVESGVIFCLRAVGEAALNTIDPSYPLAPHYLVHVGDDGGILLNHSQAKLVLDRLKTLSVGRDIPDQSAYEAFDQQTKNGTDMSHYRQALERAVEAITGTNDERATASLFQPGGTLLTPGGSRGLDDFEVVAFMVILPD